MFPFISIFTAMSIIGMVFQKAEKMHWRKANSYGRTAEN